jgi:hypothetical protein
MSVFMCPSVHLRDPTALNRSNRRATQSCDGVAFSTEVVQLTASLTDVVRRRVGDFLRGEGGLTTLSKNCPIQNTPRLRPSTPSLCERINTIWEAKGRAIDGDHPVKSLARIFLTYALPSITFALGVGAGVLLRYPTGWELPGSNAEMIGAAVGALFTVSGGFLLWQAQAELAQRNTRDAVCLSLLPIFQPTYSFMASIQAMNRESIATDGPPLVREIERALARLQRLNPSGDSVGAKNFATLVAAEDRATKLLTVLRAGIDGVANMGVVDPGDVFRPFYGEMQWEATWAVSNLSILASSAELRRQFDEYQDWFLHDARSGGFIDRDPPATTATSP